MQSSARTILEVVGKWLPITLLLGEALLSAIIVLRIPYTEIDWIAYMQEVEGWAVDGSTNYYDLRGDTGPLVYPAGFLYIYRALRWLTGGGRGLPAIRIAQWVFVALYVSTLAVVTRIYTNAKIGSPWLLVLLCASKRVHSLFMLRLFNDCWAMFFVYGAVLLCQKHKWLLATLVLSLATSIKMNALLFLPGLLFLLVRNVGVIKSAAYLLAGVALQLAIGAPFLLTHPGPYMAKAFEMSRVFFHTWTVNWKMLPEAVFVSPQVATGLLLAHAGALVAFGAYRWCEHDGGLVQVLARVGVLPRAVVPALQTAAELLGLAPLRGSSASQLEADAASAAQQISAPAPAPSPSTVRANSDRDDPMNGFAPALQGMGAAAAGSGAGSESQQLRGANAFATASWDASVTAAASAAGGAHDNGWGGSSIIVSSSSGSICGSSKGDSSNGSGSSGLSRGAFADGPAFVAYILFASNFAGIAFARTLHYQFYSWYFHSLPLLFAAARLPAPAMLALAAGIEYAFNVGDAAGAGSALSSTILQLCHFALLGALLSAPPPNPRAGIVLARPGQAAATATAGTVAAGKKQA